MYKVDVRVDGKEAAATERRRIQEYQRQSRIFNAKQRLIGVRVAASEPSTFQTRYEWTMSIPSMSPLTHMPVCLLLRGVCIPALVWMCAGRCEGHRGAGFREEDEREH